MKHVNAQSFNNSQVKKDDQLCVSRVYPSSFGYPHIQGYTS